VRQGRGQGRLREERRGQPDQVVPLGITQVGDVLLAKVDPVRLGAGLIEFGPGQFDRPRQDVDAGHPDVRQSADQRQGQRADTGADVEDLAARSGEPVGEPGQAGYETGRERLPGGRGRTTVIQQYRIRLRGPTGIGDAGGDVDRLMQRGEARGRRMARDRAVRQRGMRPDPGAGALLETDRLQDGGAIRVAVEGSSQGRRGRIASRRDERGQRPGGILEFGYRIGRHAPAPSAVVAVQFGADQRCDLGPEQLDRGQHVVVRHTTNVHLQDLPTMAEVLVQVDDALGDLPCFAGEDHPAG
jgi:hypothetical protein